METQLFMDNKKNSIREKVTNEKTFLAGCVSMDDSTIQKLLGSADPRVIAERIVNLSLSSSSSSS